MTTGIYIHIPFCTAKCDYCDFLSFAGQEALWGAYKNALLQELAAAPPILPETVYIGGGTPTLWPAAYLAEVLAALPSLQNVREFTCEANPGTLTPEKLTALRRGGVNRLSLGLQAAQAPLRAAIGRKTDGDFAAQFHMARAAGFRNISLDLMFALPGQTIAHWDETLRFAADLQPEHISAYGLTVEEGTPLFTRAAPPDEALDREMYHYCKAFLQARGYEQYELSNFARPGFQSLHNRLYWTRRPYLGFGLGAHSFWEGARFHNSTDLQTYIQNPLLREGYAEITAAEALAETAFLGLRLTEGIAEAGLEQYAPWIAKMRAEGLLCAENGRLALTGRGMDLANYVMAGFLE